MTDLDTRRTAFEEALESPKYIKQALIWVEKNIEFQQKQREIIQASLDKGLDEVPNEDILKVTHAFFLALQMHDVNISELKSVQENWKNTRFPTKETIETTKKRWSENCSQRAFDNINARTIILHLLQSGTPDSSMLPWGILSHPGQIVMKDSKVGMEMQKNQTLMKESVAKVSAIPVLPLTPLIQDTAVSTQKHIVTLNRLLQPVKPEEPVEPVEPMDLDTQYLPMIPPFKSANFTKALNEYCSMSLQVEALFDDTTFQDKILFQPYVEPLKPTISREASLQDLMSEHKPPFLPVTMEPKVTKSINIGHFRNVRAWTNGTWGPPFEDQLFLDSPF